MSSIPGLVELGVCHISVLNRASTKNTHPSASKCKVLGELVKEIENERERKRERDELLFQGLNYYNFPEIGQK